MNKSGIILLLIIFVLPIIALSVQAGEGQIELLADELLIDDLKGEIEAKGSVRLNNGDISLEASQLKVEDDFNKVTASGEVLVIEGGRRISGEEFSIDYKLESGTLTGSPRMEDGEVVVTGDIFQIDFSRDIFIISGDVEMVDQSDDFFAQADKLEYNGIEDEIILIGNVVARRGKQNMEAQKIIFNLQTKRMKAQGKTRFIIPNY